MLCFVCFCIEKALDLMIKDDIIIIIRTGGDSMKILNFGSCNIDYVYSLDHIVGIGETETTHKLETFPGGKGLNQSIAAASAIAVSRKGAAPSIPAKSEVLSSLESLKENRSNTKSDVIRKQIDSYIEKNIKTANLEELSAILGYSAVYTGSLIKKLTGKSFTKAVQEKRCSIAAEKLLNTDLSIEKIISDLGYENESFFRKIFNEKYGRNPLEYRKRGDK